MKRYDIGHTNGAKHHYIESTRGASRGNVARVWDPVEKRYVFPTNTDAMLMRNAAIDEDNERPREHGPKKQRAITQTAEAFTGMNRSERRAAVAQARLLARATAKKEAKQRGDRVDSPTAPVAVSPAADVERPCVYAKAVHAAKMVRRRERARAGHGGAASRVRRTKQRALARAAAALSEAATKMKEDAP